MRVDTKELDFVTAELCLKSFYEFVKEFIDIIDPSANSFVWNWHIKYLCDRAQEEIENYFRKIQ